MRKIPINPVKQVVAPKGLDTSCPTTVVIPNLFFIKGQNQRLKHFGTKMNYQLTQLTQVKTRLEESVMGTKIEPMVLKLGF